MDTMRSTYTVAVLPIPKAAWDYIADAVEDAGYDNHSPTEINGEVTVMIDMKGIAVVPLGDRDSFHNAGRLSDLLVQAGENAFRAGHAAGQRGDFVDHAWDRYEVPEDIHDLMIGL